MLYDLHLDAAVVEGLLGDGVALFAGLQLGHLDCVSLEEAVELLLLAPGALVVVEADSAAGDINDGGIAPSRVRGWITRPVASPAL